MNASRKRARTVSELGLRLLHCKIIHRHGDRAPSLNFYKHSVGSRESKEKAAEVSEASKWIGKMPCQDKLKELAARFPVIQKDGHLEDPAQASAGYPFGHLTNVGLTQLYDQGVAHRRRYEKEFQGLKRDDVYAQSTNYHRTQESCQSFLEGFLDKDWSVPIHVYEARNDFLNAWDSENGLQEAVFKMTDDDKEFESQEQKHSEIRRALCTHLPYYNAFPENFLWIYSADYYLCNKAHAIETHEELEEHRDTVLNLVAWRFLRWYHDREVGKLAIGEFSHLVREIFKSKIDDDNITLPAEVSGKKFSFFSAHDVTLLPFMVAIGAFKDHDPELIEFEKVWPAYGTVLCIEHLADEDNEQYVRVLRNQEEIYPLTHIDKFKFIWE